MRTLRLPGSPPPSPPPAMRFLAVLPVPATLLVLAVLRPDLLFGLIASPRAWLVSAGVLLASVATRRLVRRWSPLGAVWSGPAVTLGLLAVLLAPSFQERTLVEAFPPVLASPVADAAPVPTATPVSPTSPTTPPPKGSSATKTPVLTARLLASGVLRGVGHRASGRAEAYAFAGRVVIRFASVSLPGAPAQSVHLVPLGARAPRGGVTLGRLKAEHGSFSYTAPVGFDVAKAWTVLVWCDDYAVPIAAADLA